MWKYILFTVILIAVLVIVYSFFFSDSSSSPKSYSLAYDGITLYKSSTPLIYSSDGSSYIYYNTSKGVVAYNIDDKTSKTITSYPVSGLAYDTTTDKLLMTIDGSLYSINYDGTQFSGPLSTKVTKLYDTTDGYYISAGGTYSINGTSKAKNLGDYGIVTFDTIIQ